MDSFPLTPPPGLLMSMAIRLDHALGCPGYYDQPIFASQGISHADRLRAALADMEKVYHEVTGYGFYYPGKEEAYAEMLKESGI